MDGRSSLSHGPTLLPELERAVSILSNVEGQRHEKIAAARDRNELQQEEKNIEPMISSGKMADMIRRFSPRGERRRVIACGGVPRREAARVAAHSHRTFGCKNVESPPPP